jgi:hypothetical protein
MKTKFLIFLTTVAAIAAVALYKLLPAAGSKFKE